MFDGETADDVPGLLRLLQAAFLFLGALLASSVAVQGWTALVAAVGVVAAGSTPQQLLRTVVQFATLSGFVGLFVLAANERDMVAVSWPDRRTIAVGLGGAAVLVGAQYALLALLSLVGVAPVQNSAIDPSAYAPAYFLWMIPVSILVVGPAEELLFRGAIQRLVRDAAGPWVGVVVGAGLFGLIHYGVGSGSPAEQWAYVAVAGVLGLGLGYLYEWQGNLVVPAIAHGGYNAVAFLLQYLSVTGGG